MRLTLDLNGRMIVSSQINMRIFRKAQSMLSEGADLGDLGEMLVAELFDGTEVSKQVLDKLELAEQVFLADTAVELFLNELDKVNKLKKNNPIVKVKVV